ncbi:hypothetical protein Tco_1152468, partial [Tanacetum coccineum]
YSRLGNLAFTPKLFDPYRSLIVYIFAQSPTYIVLTYLNQCKFEYISLECDWALWIGNAVMRLSYDDDDDDDDDNDDTSNDEYKTFLGRDLEWQFPKMNKQDIQPMTD